MRFWFRAVLTLAFSLSLAGISVRAQEATPVVTTYGEVEALYTEMRDATLDDGRRVTEQLVGGEAAAVHERMSPELQGLIGVDDLNSLVADLQSDRVRFVIPGIGLTFSGRLDGDLLSGFVTGGGIGGFELSRAAESASGDLLAGEWTGAMSAGGQVVELEVAIEGSDDQWSGTASIPELELLDVAIEDVSFAASLPIGELIDDRALPHSGAMMSYWARYVWGEENLTFQFGFDGDGMLTLAQIAPEETFPPADMSTALTGLEWPLPGLWWVGWGGDSVLENYHAVAPSQRHALDLLMWKDGATFATDGTSNEDYWAWGQPVLAPAGGTIVDVLDGLADNVPGVVNPEGHPAGNHVVVQAGEQEFIYLGHLQEGSIEVAVGDDVVAGDLIGLVGNSGNSTEPHLHIHAQTVQEYFDPAAVGLPLIFAELTVDGETAANAQVRQGSFIAG